MDFFTSPRIRHQLTFVKLSDHMAVFPYQQGE